MSVVAGVLALPLGAAPQQWSVDDLGTLPAPFNVLLRFEADGRCSDLGEYWHVESGTHEPFAGWGA